MFLTWIVQLDKGAIGCYINTAKGIIIYLRCLINFINNVIEHMHSNINEINNKNGLIVFNNENIINILNNIIIKIFSKLIK